MPEWKKALRTAARPASETVRVARWPRLAFGALSPAGPRARLQVLLFHRVREVQDPLFPNEMTAAEFRRRMLWIREWFHVLPLPEAVRALANGSLPSRALAVTFDDGYADNATVAVPILREAGVPATFFVATGFLDGGRMWNDTVIESVRNAVHDVLDVSAAGLGSFVLDCTGSRRAAIDALIARLKPMPPAERDEMVDAVARASGARLPHDLMMSSAQVGELAAAGMTIGAHTVNHPLLSSVDAATARREMADSRALLSELCRSPVTLFAYPNGRPQTDYRQRDVELARTLGFEAAFSTAAGAASARHRLHELPRFTPWDRTPRGWALRLARNYLTSVQYARAA